LKAVLNKPKGDEILQLLSHLATSDKIRNQLAEIGIQLKDEKDGNMSWNLS